MHQMIAHVNNWILTATPAGWVAEGSLSLADWFSAAVLAFAIAVIMVHFRITQLFDTALKRLRAAFAWIPKR